MSQSLNTASPAEPGRRGPADAWTVTVLLVEADTEGARRIEDALSGSGLGDFRIETVSSVDNALERLKAGDVDVVLVGLGRGDHERFGAFELIRRATPDALVLPLSDIDPEAGDRRAEAYWLPYTLRYVTQRKAAEAALRSAEEIVYEEKERARVTLSSIGDAVLVTDLAGRVMYLNPMAEAMTGWGSGEAVGCPLSEVFDIIDGSTREPAEDPTERAMREDRTVGLAANCVLVRRDGNEAGIEDSAAPIHDRHGQVCGAVIVFRDINQSRAVTRKMAYLAQHDALTGLPNRVLLNDRLDQAMRYAHRNKQRLAVLFLDLDGFKEINDSEGHQIGDYALQAVARRLNGCVRKIDTVSRLGGDEFVILLTEIERSEDATRVAAKISEAFSEPLPVDGHSLRLTASIGISVYPEDGREPDTLMHRADEAMYVARTKHHGTYQFPSPESGRASPSRSA